MLAYPNTFPFPNEIINGWNARLKASELKVLLVVTRQTLGWVLDSETGMRKEEDWITYKQFKQKTGLSTRSLSTAIDALVRYKLIQVRNKDGSLLDTPYKRELEGKRRGSFFYRLNLTVLKSKADCVKNFHSTVLKINSYKRNSIQKKLLQKRETPKKYSSIKDILEEDLVEISQRYKVSLGFVKLQFEKMKNWLESSGKTKRNYKATLRNFVLGDMQKQIEGRQSEKYRAVDARHIK